MYTKEKELTWFKLSLLHFLYESHPELTNDNDLLNTRGDAAARIYSEAINSGSYHNEAERLAHDELYKGLRFSKYDTLVTIIWNQFSDFIPMGKAREFALKLQPGVERIFDKYELNDDFVYSQDFNELYKELTDSVSKSLETNKPKQALKL